MLRYQDVFVAGGFPNHTYNARWNLGLEPKLELARDNLCKLVAVTGHTKSGKTVLARKVFPRDSAIWIEGGSISNSEDFWETIVEQLGLHQEVQNQQSLETSSTLGSKTSAGIGFGIAKWIGELAGSIARLAKTSVTASRTLSSKSVALRAVRTRRTPLVIDDFHYLQRDLQAQIVRALKSLVFEGIPVVLIAIPQRRFDAVRVEREMTARVHAVHVPEWSIEELQFIANQGFKKLNRPPPVELERFLAEQAIGSPHVMQELCREICRVHSVHFSLPTPPQPLVVSAAETEAALRYVADSLGRPILDKILRASSTQGERAQYTLANGQTVGIGGLIVRALANVRPGLVTLEFEDVRSAIRTIAPAARPRRAAIEQVLKQMATVAATDESSTPVIDFEEPEGRLHITDPLFAFILRWGQFDG